MEIIARSSQQIGAALRRCRRQKNLTQTDLGERMNVRQATVSKLESGGPATRISTLVDALAALDLELVVRPRSTISVQAIEDLF